ncbi:MAG: pantetheine-phosphate adenylyltransferase [Acidobacteriota bacterium]
MKEIAIYPGSFDPMTNGHVDIVRRSRELFSKVVIAILQNPQKQALFTVEERLEMLAEHYDGDTSVEIYSFSGLLVEFATQIGAQVIVRGLRAPTDFEYELQMALMNRRLDDKIETLFMVPSEPFTFVSSSLIKEVCALGGSVKGLVPPPIEKRLCDKLARISQRLAAARAQGPR